jgi:hypothetical protein
MPDQFPLADLTDLADPELEQLLTGLGPHVFPATPDLAGHVRTRLEREPAAHPRRPLTSTATGQRSLWLAVALLLIALIGGLVLFPEARSAIADRIGLRGALIEWVDETPTPGLLSLARRSCWAARSLSMKPRR